MHAPDGFLTAGTAIATGAISTATIGILLRTGRSNLSERQIPLAGASAAFLFAAQMVNFPVAAGTTGHLLGDGRLVPDVGCLEAGGDLGVSPPSSFEIVGSNGLTFGRQRGRSSTYEQEQDEGDACCHCLAINSTIVDGPAAPAGNLTLSSANSLFN